ncbi:unnamed protein product, partial [Ectocarpus sp. 6 AP-2014]
GDQGRTLSYCWRLGLRPENSLSTLEATGPLRGFLGLRTALSQPVLEESRGGQETRSGLWEPFDCYHLGVCGVR